MLAMLLLMAVPAFAQQEITTGGGTTGEQTTGGSDNSSSGNSGSGSSAQKVTQTFELTVEGAPPAGERFFGLVIPPEGAPASPTYVPLSDPDGDGTYTGSNFFYIPVPPRDSPPDLVNDPPTIQIVQGRGLVGPGISNGCEFGGCTPETTTRVIKDFGVVPLNEDKTFSASVSFPDNGGSNTPESTAPEPTPPGTTTGESVAPEPTTPSTTTGEKTRRGRGERTGGETTGGGTPETTNNNGGSSDANGGGGGNAAGGDSQGGISGAVGNAFGNLGRGRLPDTGGGWVVLLLAAAVLIGGGWILVRRATASR